MHPSRTYNVSFDAAAGCSTLLLNDPIDNDDDVQDFIVTPSGTRLPVTPKFKMAGTARYTGPMWAGKVPVQGSVTHQSVASVDLRVDAGGFNPNDFTGRLHGWTTLDLFTGYDWSNFTAELFVTNVFDKSNELARFVQCSICTRGYVSPDRRGPSD